MKIETERVGYYFPCRSALEKFIKTYQTCLFLPDSMLRVYGPEASTTFDFRLSKRDGLYHWSHCYRFWYVQHGYEIVMYAPQRTE